MLGLIVIIIVAVILIYFISVSNKFKRSYIKVQEAQADIEVALIKRYDVLTQSLDVVKGYTEHEKNLMIQLIQARNGMSLAETQQVLDNQADALHRINAVAEAYPQLYSSELYKNLQYQIVETNEHLSASKRLYHANVSLYNQEIAVFPASVVAALTGRRPAEYLRDENLAAKREVNLSFQNGQI